MMNLVKRFIHFATLLGSIVLGILVAGFLIYLAVTIMWQGDKASVEKADAIIVLTGGKGRIETAFDLLLDDKAERLLITGVNNETTLADIIDIQTLPAQSLNQLKSHCCITLDYAADTTEANAREANEWVTRHNVKTVILVTASYHMPRAALLFDRALRDNNTDIKLFPVRDERRAELAASKDYWLLIGREYTKYLGSWVRLQNKEQDQ